MWWQRPFAAPAVVRLRRPITTRGTRRHLTIGFTCPASCKERDLSKNRNAGPVKCNAWFGGCGSLVPPEHPRCDVHEHITSFEAYLWQTLGAVHDAPEGARHRADRVHIAAARDDELHHCLK